MTGDDSLNYSIFLNMVFPPDERWADEGVHAKALGRLNAEEIARAETLLLSVLPASLDPRPFMAAGLLRLASAAPLLRQRLADDAADGRAAAQTTVLAAAGALRRLGETTVAQGALLRAWRLMTSYAFGEQNGVANDAWGILLEEVSEWEPSAAITKMLLAFIADESWLAQVDAEFAALAQPDVGIHALAADLPPDLVETLRPKARQKGGGPSLAVWAHHLQAATVGIERIGHPYARARVVELLEGMGATAAGRAALAAIDAEERASLAAWLRHRLVVHNDRNVLLSLGLVGSRESLTHLTGVVRSQAGEYDAARAAVACYLIAGFDALPIVEQVIHHGRQAKPTGYYTSHRALAVRLLAYLPLGRADVRRLLLGIGDNDDGYACYVLLTWLERFATTPAAREQLADAIHVCQGRPTVVDGELVRRPQGARPTATALTTLAELLDV